MSYHITEDCVSCGDCSVVCPEKAIDDGYLPRTGMVLLPPVPPGPILPGGVTGSTILVQAVGIVWKFAPQAPL